MEKNQGSDREVRGVKKVQFTPKQQEVIDTREKNILVSAAAGSGKTAVLVERILELILDKNKPVDIDRLLIVTFTNAAAVEMRERIGKAIEKRLETEPENLYLQRQATLLHRAQITTIDSFCLFVIRNNFNEIGLDPGFRVADSGEIELLKQDIIKETFEQLLEDEKTKDDFIQLLENVAVRGKEKVLEELVLKIYNFSQSCPWPEEWLKERYHDYEVQGSLEETSWGKMWTEELQKKIAELERRLQELLRDCQSPGGAYMYTDALVSDLDIVCYLKEKSWQEQYDYIRQVSFARLSSKKDAGVLPERKESVKNQRDDIKKEIGNLQKKFFCLSEETIKEQMKEICKVEKTLIDTVLLFGKKFEERKREKNLLDFSDMEHMALKILLQPEKDKKTGEIYYEATKTAKDYRSYFKEIMIDEYQDSNLVQEYLLQSICGESEGRYNRFMVGDLKQSIYKFRLARPEIFLEKYHHYGSRENAHCVRIDLHKNFRSRKEVLDSVNDVFYQIMSEEVGQIQYTEEEALYPGASYTEGKEDYTTELLLLDLEEEAEEAKKAEAEMTAARIKQLVGSFLVTDSETGELRPAEYGDIVVLLRSNAGWDEEFFDVFSKQDIPACITRKTGYFNAKEIQILLAFLKVIDNPRQDIPLYATLKSLLGRFTDEEIVRIKSHGKNCLYENLKEVREGSLADKVQAFLQTIEKYRNLVYIMPIHKLLRVYLKETGYIHYFTGLPGGEQRIQNIKMLLKKAEDYEKTSYFGLFHFIRYMENLRKYDVDVSESVTVEKERNEVRIMSIHKSKGLEFPICIVAGLSKKMNQQDVNAGLVCDMEFGIGMEYRNPILRVKNQDMRRNAIAQKMRMDNLGEELRILYVAMTRAKEKLIMTGTVKNYEEQMLSFGYLKNRSEKKLPFGVISSANSFLDFILPATVQKGVRIRTVLWNAFEAKAQEESYQTGLLIERLNVEEKMRIPAGEKERRYMEAVKEKLSFTYAHENLRGLYAKTTVSELKKKAMEEADYCAFEMFEEAEVTPYIPSFVEEKEKVDGSARGNAYHRLMELLDFSKLENTDAVFEKWESLAKEKILKPEYLSYVRKEKLELFLKSSLAARMKKAWEKGVLYREQPFVLGVAAKRLDAKFPEGEKVLVQGIIDAFFVEQGEIVLVDYKTDAVRREEELIERYKEQLKYYEEALEKLTGKKVKEKLLYSFALNRCVYVE